MTQALSTHKTNTVLGNGEIFFDRQDENGQYTGERYLGDSVGATLSVTTERTTIQSGDGAIAQDLVDIPRSVSREMGFTVRDSSLANWALFLIGDDEAVTVAATQAKSTFPLVKKGTWIQLGQSAANPGGVGAVGAASDDPASGKTSVKSSADSSSAAAKTAQSGNYSLDAASGRLTALKDLYKVEVTYTPVAVDRRRAKATTAARSLTGALRYIEDNPAAGKGRSVYIRKCNLVPGGELALKSRETEQQMAFTAAIQDPTDDSTKYPAVAIDGEDLS